MQWNNAGKRSAKLNPVGLNQYAVCKQEGHWKNECLKRRGPKERDRAENANLIMLEDSDNE